MKGVRLIEVDNGFLAASHDGHASTRFGQGSRLYFVGAMPPGHLQVIDTIFIMVVM